jgi:cell division protein FtsB
LLRNKIIEQDTIQDTIVRLQSINGQQKEAQIKLIKENTFYKENLKKLQDELSKFKKASEIALDTLKVTFSKEKTDFLFHIKTLKGLLDEKDHQERALTSVIGDKDKKHRDLDDNHQELTTEIEELKKKVLTQGQMLGDLQEQCDGKHSEWVDANGRFAKKVAENEALDGKNRDLEVEIEKLRKIKVRSEADGNNERSMLNTALVQLQGRNTDLERHTKGLASNLEFKGADVDNWKQQYESTGKIFSIDKQRASSMTRK